MALTAWRDLRFFDVSPVRLEDGEGSVALDKNNTSCLAARPDNIVVGTPNGFVHLLNQNFKSTRSWKAHNVGSITHIEPIPDTAYVVTIAEDLSHEPELKVWSLEQSEKSGQPKCLCTVRVVNGKEIHPVTAFSATADLAQVAVGFGNGGVTVVRGDFIHDRGTKQRTVFESKEPITGLEFREANTTALYIATTSRVLALPITGSKQGTAARKLDDSGCAVGCMTLDRESNEVIVARDDAIHAYSPSGKAFYCAYEGAKKLVRVRKDYVLLVSPPTNPLSRSAPLRAFGGTQAQEILNSSSFTILDPNLQIIAYSEPLSEQVNTVFSIWGDIYLLTIDGKLFRYHEKTLQQKLDMLYQRDLYILAINMAQKYKVDPIQRNVISRKYGDFLYQKGDYDTAMQQYLQAIDNTEPSQIIRKFLDSQRIDRLIEYLEELHEHHKATSDHTTLLLNCYAKRKNVDKLEEFIRQPGDLKFDLDTAIVMCRQGGYYDQAAFLARRHDEHGLVVDILIEDLKKYAEALAYIVRLEPREAYPNFMKFGTVLLENCSRETTQLFIDYFTGTFRPKKDAVIVQQAPTAQESSGIGTMAQSAVQSLASLIPLPYMNTGVTNSPRQSSDGAKATVNQVVETIADSDFIEYDVPRPRVAFSAFIDHPDEFITFLEACIANTDGIKPVDRTDLYTTLFEIYLHKASNTIAEEKTEWERKARSLISSNNVPIDPSNVLLLSDLEQFRDGTVLVSEKHGLYFDIFRSYTTAGDTRGAIKALKKYGPEEPQLYPAALAYFTSSPETLRQAGSEVDAVLKKIDDDALMAPLQVIQTLSTNAVATMGLVKSYLKRTVERERSEIASNRRLASDYRADAAQKRAEIDALASPQQPVAFTATRCSSCNRALDLPTVRFLCKHSFHQACLNVADGQALDNNDAGAAFECPVCAPQNKIVIQIKSAQEDSARRHDLFEHDLAGKSDRFGTISDWFRRGVMSVKTSAE